MSREEGKKSNRTTIVTVIAIEGESERDLTNPMESAIHRGQIDVNDRRERERQRKR